MLWRECYHTAQAEEVPLPALMGTFLSGDPWLPLNDFILVGAFDLRGLGEIGIWERLLDDAGVGTVTVLFHAEWPTQERSVLEASVPYSRHPQTLMADDPSGEWLDLISPDRHERAFAAIVRGHVARLLMVGAPTEEALDAFNTVIGA